MGLNPVGMQPADVVAQHATLCGLPFAVYLMRVM